MTLTKLLKKERFLRVMLIIWAISAALSVLTSVAQILIVKGVLPNPDPLVFSSSKPEAEKEKSR